MATTTLNGNDIPLKISTDAGTTYKSVVCATTSGIEITRDISEKETKCGLLSTVGNAKWSANVEGVVNTTPAGTEVSYEDLLGIIVNNTATLIKVESPVAAGTARPSARQIRRRNGRGRSAAGREGWSSHPAG